MDKVASVLGIEGAAHHLVTMPATFNQRATFTSGTTIGHSSGALAGTESWYSKICSKKWALATLICPETWLEVQNS